MDQGSIDRTALWSLLEAKGWKLYKLARVSGVDYSSLHRIASGKALNPTIETVQKLARALGVRAEDLAVASGEEPDLPTLAAGLGAPADLPGAPRRHGDTFAFEVRGDCLEPVIKPGYVCWVQPSDATRVRPGQYVVAVVDGERVVKRYERGDGVDYLVAEKPGYPPIAVNPNVEIVGVVRRVEHEPGQ